MLIPLADLLGVSVTELLMGERMTDGGSMQTDAVEHLVKTAITYADEKPKRAYHEKSIWPVFYGISLLIGGLGTFLNYKIGQSYRETLPGFMIMCAAFGAYFCFFVRMKLPSFYDENHISVFFDGPIRMNIAGLRLHNGNWPHIVRAARISLCLSMITFPMLAFLMGRIGWDFSGNFVLMAFFFCACFLPIYIVGNKYKCRS